MLYLIDGHNSIVNQTPLLNYKVTTKYCSKKQKNHHSLNNILKQQRDNIAIKATNE